MNDQAANDLAEARRLAEQVAAWAGTSIELRPLPGGITNRNFVATVRGAQFVIRLPGERTDLLGIDRSHEASAAARAAALGIGPALAGELPGAGTMITELVSGTHPTQAQLVERLAEVVALLRRFHGSGPLAASFPIHRVVERHARDAGKHGVPPPPLYERLRRQSLRIENAFSRAPQPAVPCHNDLLPANLLFAAERIWLLDYEYAGMNDPFFDLANLSVNAGLVAGTEELLLRHYFGTVSPSAWARLQLMKIMSEFREGMWAVLQQAISRLDNDFAAYSKQRLSNCAQLIASAQFELWLEQASEPPGPAG